VSDQLEATNLRLSVEPAPTRGRDRRLVGAVVVIAIVAAVVVTLIARGSDGSAAGPTKPSPSSSQPATAAPLVAIRALLQRRSAAIVDHDRAAFLSTVDPDEAGFFHSQARMFANLASVRFASWSYQIGSKPAGPDGRRLAKYDAPVWAPAHFALHYRIAGFDPTATDLPQYPTFVERAGRWYLASLSDFRAQGDISATDLWDYAPVQVITHRSVLVLGAAGQKATMIDVADQMQAAIPRVTAVWGRHWARRVIVQVPSTQREMGAITGDHGDLSQIAALTSAEVSSTPGRPRPVGDRVTINPRTWRTLSHLGAAIVLTHELTHVATRADTGTQTPRWLAEGFADYVGFKGTGVAVQTAAAELTKAVRAGRFPARLPGNAAFGGAARRVPQAYEVSWLACRYIAVQYGQHALVRFYRSVGRSRLPTRAAVATAVHRVLGVTAAQFTAGWRGYVRRELT
jgi:hypothetical protein